MDCCRSCCRRKRLSWGNGVIELGTFLAAITGDGAGRVFVGGIRRDGSICRESIFLACSAVGLVTSFGISKVPAADPGKVFRANFLGDLWAQCRLILQGSRAVAGGCGNTYFFFLAGLLQFAIVFYGRDVLHVPATQSGLLQAAVAIGIGLGSLAAGYLSGGKIEYGLIPLGALGMTVFGFLLAAPGHTFMQRADAAGRSGVLRRIFHAVPISALIQHRPEEQASRRSDRGREPACRSSGFSWLRAFITFSNTTLHLEPRSDIFCRSSVMTLAATVYVLICCPIRCCVCCCGSLTHTLYRIGCAGAGQHSRARRGAAGAEPRVVGGRGAADGGD